MNKKTKEKIINFLYPESSNYISPMFFALGLVIIMTFLRFMTVGISEDLITDYGQILTIFILIFFFSFYLFFTVTLGKGIYLLINFVFVVLTVIFFNNYDVYFQIIIRMVALHPLARFIQGVFITNKKWQKKKNKQNI